jgi:hypothetical protein
MKTASELAKRVNLNQGVGKTYQDIAKVIEIAINERDHYIRELEAKLCGAYRQNELLRVTSRDHNDALQKRINDLEKGNAKLKDTLSDLSWRLFPDRMGE